MRIFVPLALAAALATLLGFLLRTEGAGGELSPAAARSSLAAPSPPADEAAPAVQRQDVAEPAREALEAEPAPSASAAPPCVVIGRVLDQEGAPIEGALVRLSAFRVWAEGVDVPRLEGRYDMRGFEVATDSSGIFRIEAPPPTAPRTALTIAPHRFHDSHVVRFDSERGTGQPALGAGLRDLGEIRLAATGAISGCVTDESGYPLGEVKITIGSTRITTFSRDAWTEPDGTYLVAHAPVGTYGVGANAEGYLAHFLEPVTVEARRDTTGVDFALRVAPTIEGIVVDERGLPVEGARIWGWPESSGRGAGATSGPDGRFLVHLPQDEPYTLSAKLDGYDPWGREHDKSLLFEPGARDVHVALRALPRTRFCVVDDATGDAIERFGLSILQDNGSRSSRHVYTERRPPVQAAHPGGVAEATAREGLDLYVIAADGYLLATGDVEHDGPDAPVQTVRMRRGCSVRGRVLRDGAAVAGAPVELVRILGYGATRGSELDRDRYTLDQNEKREARTDADGRFELLAVAPGGHQLRVIPADGAPLVLAPVHVGREPVLELGELALLPGATIAGEVLLPAGVRPAGLEVRLGDRRSGHRAVCDGAGRFRFEQLSPGLHFLSHGGRPGELDGGEPVRVELAPGETAAVTLDAREHAMCTLVLTIALGELPASGSTVYVVHADDPGRRARVGECDPAGVVRGSVRAFGQARVEVTARPGMHVLVHPDLVLELAPLARVERAVRFELARLTLRLPAGVEPPRDGRATLRLAPFDAGRAAQVVYARFAEGAPSRDSAFFLARAGELSFGGLLAGPQRLTLELTDDASELVEVPAEGGRWRMERTPYYRATGEVTLVAGESIALQL